MNDELDLDHAMHLCVCVVSVNDGMTTYHYDETRPISWPEIQIIQHLWGEENVFNITPIKAVFRPRAVDEKQRLCLIYGRDRVEEVFAGKNPNIEWFVPGWSKDPAKDTRKKADNYKPPKQQFGQPDTAARNADI